MALLLLDIANLKSSHKNFFLLTYETTPTSHLHITPNQRNMSGSHTHQPNTSAATISTSTIELQNLKVSDSRFKQEEKKEGDESWSDELNPKPVQTDSLAWPNAGYIGCRKLPVSREVSPPISVSLNSFCALLGNFEINDVSSRVAIDSRDKALGIKFDWTGGSRFGLMLLAGKCESRRVELRAVRE